MEEVRIVFNWDKKNNKHNIQKNAVKRQSNSFFVAKNNGETKNILAQNAGLLKQSFVQITAS